jgi:hypothetical protein
MYGEVLSGVRVFVMKTFDHQISDELEKQLIVLYVALEMTRDVAKRGVSSKSDDQRRALLTLLNVASEMLEEILDPQPLEIPSTLEVTEVEAIM